VLTIWVTGLPKGKISWFVLQTASEETYFSLKETLVELTLGRSVLQILVFHHEDHR
jgi:hypothetical protein